MKYFSEETAVHGRAEAMYTDYAGRCEDWEDSVIGKEVKGATLGSSTSCWL